MSAPGRRLLCLSAAAAILAACLSGCAAGRIAPAETPRLAGRVTYRGAPVAGATVRFHDRYGAAERHVAAEVKCDADGKFEAAVAPGTYYVEASGTFEDRAVFAFSGQNPVRVEKGSRWLGMKAVRAVSPEVVPGPPGGAAVEGMVLFGGMAVEGAYVYVYPSPGGLLKGMGIAMSPPTGPDGKFAVENLPESAYYLVARRRGTGGMTGPLEKGDLYGFYPGNPVYLREGAVTRIVLETVEKEKPLTYSEVTSGTETVLRGRVVDRRGEPQSGVYAFVYDDRVFGHRRPYGHSGRTGPDGAFAIYLDRGGVFYLGARENFGDSPKPGERLGFYAGTPDHALRVEAGRPVDGLVVVVEPVLAEAR